MTTPLLLLTFDDRTVGSWYAHRGLFEEAGAHATFFVSDVDELTDADVDQLQTLQRDGHTVGSHGLRHLDAPAAVAERGVDAYLEDEIAPSVAGLADRGLGHRDFAYPFGRRDPALDERLLTRFSWLRATSVRHEDERAAARVLVDLGDPRSRVLPSRNIDVGRGGTAHPDDRDALRAVLDEAGRTGRSLCLFAHDIAGWSEGAARSRHFLTPERLREVLREATERGLTAVGTGALPD